MLLTVLSRGWLAEGPRFLMAAEWNASMSSRQIRELQEWSIWSNGLFLFCSKSNKNYRSEQYDDSILYTCLHFKCISIPSTNIFIVREIYPKPSWLWGYKTHKKLKVGSGYHTSDSKACISVSKSIQQSFQYLKVTSIFSNYITCCNTVISRL